MTVRYPLVAGVNGMLMARRSWGELRIASEFLCVAHERKARVSFRFAECLLLSDRAPRDDVAGLRVRTWAQ